MCNSNYHYLTSSLKSFGQPFDNRISKRISTPIVKRSSRECHGNVYRIKKGAGKAVRTRNETKRPINEDIFQCGGCDTTRIRHTVSIVFINQLGSRPLS